MWDACKRKVDVGIIMRDQAEDLQGRSTARLVDLRRWGREEVCPGEAQI